jgi:hypothetical protein
MDYTHTEFLFSSTSPLNTARITASECRKIFDSQPVHIKNRVRKNAYYQVLTHIV